MASTTTDPKIFLFPLFQRSFYWFCKTYSYSTQGDKKNTQEFNFKVEILLVRSWLFFAAFFLYFSIPFSVISFKEKGLLKTRAPHIDMLSAIPAAFAMPRSHQNRVGRQTPRHSGSGDRGWWRIGTMAYNVGWFVVLRFSTIPIRSCGVRGPPQLYTTGTTGRMMSVPVCPADSLCKRVHKPSTKGTVTELFEVRCGWSFSFYLTALWNDKNFIQIRDKDRLEFVGACKIYLEKSYYVVFLCFYISI